MFYQVIIDSYVDQYLEKQIEMKMFRNIAISKTLGQAIGFLFSSVLAFNID
jgi:hypothetical protein